MSARFLYRWAPIVIAINILAGYLAGGWRGAAGIALGFFVSAFGLTVWWLVVQALGNLARVDDPKPSAASALVVVGFLFKVPLFLGAVLLTVKIGGISRTCFLIGFGQVYLALVGRAMARDADQPT